MKFRMRKILSLLLAASLLFSAAPVFASSGFEEVRKSVFEIDGNLSLTSASCVNTADSSLLSENYYTFVPGGEISPIVSFGNDIRGAASYAKALDIEESKGFKILGGCNGDFFTMADGISLGPVVSGGTVCTSGRRGYESVGFASSGEAYIGDPDLNVILENPNIGRNFERMSFNKALSKNSGFALFSSVYGKDNAAEGKTVNALIKIKGGEARIGEALIGRIEDIFEAEGAVPLYPGYLLLSVCEDTAYSSVLPVLKSMSEGDDIFVSFEAAPGWEDMEYVLGGDERLIANGVVSEISGEKREPRTALGIKKNGELILYTADGRNDAHSAGLSLRELAERLKALGCTDAVNLDGGGSTQLHCSFPGFPEDKLVNIPSENRRAANYIMFAVKASSPKRASELYLYPYDALVLAGSEVNFEAKASDDAYNPAELPAAPVFGADKGIGSFEGSLFTASEAGGKGRVYVKSGRLSAYADINVIGSPDGISICDAAGKPVEGTLFVRKGEEIKLSAKAMYKNFPITAGEKSFSWSVSENFGSVSETGVYTASEDSADEGTLTVSCGNTSASIAMMADNTAPSVIPELRGTHLSASISDNADPSVSRGNIELKLDGKAFSRFDYDEASGALSADFSFCEPGLHHIILKAEDTSGNKVMKPLRFSVEPYETGKVFKDMPENHFAAKYAEYLNARGLIYGRGGEPPRFDPQTGVTRQEFTVMVMRLLGTDTAAYADVKLPYADADKISDYALSSVKAAAALGYISGKGSEGKLRFDPAGGVTREEAMTIIGRILGKGYGKADLGVFEDESRISGFARPYVAMLTEQGVVSGSNGRMNPKSTMTRAEVALVIFNCY